MKTEILAHIIKHPVIPVYYNDDLNICLEVLKSCYDGGIKVFEFTNRGVHAPKNFEAMIKYRDQFLPDLILGIGTIKTVDTAELYIKLNANFIVSPIVKQELAEITSAHETFWIPGCMTPTEISLAEELDAQLIKLFPGDILGPGFLKGIKPLFPSLRFMPTGGVSLEEENIKSWLDVGVTAMGFGSKLFEKTGLINDKNWLTERCRKLTELVKTKEI